MHEQVEPGSLNGAGRMNRQSLADPEVRVGIGRRVFSAAYKARILAEADACPAGEVGALLRREGLYSSHLSDWRRQREAGGLAGLEPKARGRKASSPEAQRIATLERELARTQRRLEQAEAIIRTQKKLAALVALSEEPSIGEFS